MKTVSELNSKWWYRLVKVAYVAVFAIFALGAVSAITDEFWPTSIVIDHEVVCLEGNRSTFQASRDERIDLSSYSSDIGLSTLSNPQRYSLRVACGLEAKAETPREAIIAMRGNDTIPAITITEISLTDGGFVEAIVYSLAALLGVAVVFELFRRLFYYVVLGSLRPKKK